MSYRQLKAFREKSLKNKFSLLNGLIFGNGNYLTLIILVQYKIYF